MPAFVDKTNKVYDRITVLALHPSEKGEPKKWLCVCECGTFFSVLSNNLGRGHTRSCGCYKIDLVKSRAKHNMSESPEYRTWAKIKNRCYSVDDPRYVNYGARGIDMQESWKDEFINFFNDMGPRPSSNHSIERLDVNKGYYKENCIWVEDQSIQVFNQTLKVNNTSGRTGVYWDKKSNKWLVKLGKAYKRYRFGLYETFEEAVLAVEKAEIELYGKVRSNFK